MAARGCFVKRDFTDLGQIPERQLKISQMGLQCVHWMDFVPYLVFCAILRNKNDCFRATSLFTIASFSLFLFLIIARWFEIFSQSFGIHFESKDPSFKTKLGAVANACTGDDFQLIADICPVPRYYILLIIGTLEVVFTVSPETGPRH